MIYNEFRTVNDIKLTKCPIGIKFNKISEYLKSLLHG